MSDHRHDDPPSPLVVRWSADMLVSVPPRRRALDIAMGRGRHARLLADTGYSVFGVDWQIDAVRDATAHAGRGRLHAWVADLTSHPLPHEAFELIVVSRYLQRDLFPAIAAALVPGGVIVYETFTTHQRALGWGPKSPDHLLEPGELQTRLRDAGLIELFSEETVAPEAVARFVGRRTA
jgi:SAM-dependent methyltransferase